MPDDKMLDQEFKPEELDIEVTLRPSTLDEFIGQTRVKENLKVFIEAAKIALMAVIKKNLFPSDPGSASNFGFSIVMSSA